jgi:hypothetical protein
MNRPICDYGLLSSRRCRKPATVLVVYPSSPGGHERCDPHADQLTALIEAKGKGPVTRERLS